MTNHELFDLIFEGTTVEDSLRLEEYRKDRVIVVDANGTYGSTFEGYDGLRGSTYVRNCVLNRRRDPAEKRGCILIEAFPAVMRPVGDGLTRLKDTKMMELLRFIRILSHYYVAGSSIYRIPYSSKEIVDSKVLSYDEMYLFGRFVKREIDLETFKSGLSDGVRRILVNGVMEGDEENHEGMKRYMESFGGTPFLYPEHGFKEISEMFARSNSMCGVAYLLDRRLRITERSESDVDAEEVPAEYRFRADSEYGTVYSKIAVRRENKGSVGYVRVVNTSKQLYDRTFVAYVERGALMKVICLNSDTKCCPEGTFLLYFIKRDGAVDDEDLGSVGVDKDDIIEDISYEVPLRLNSDCILANE
jgi:RAB protein geranylgeranyltransferase component A